MLDFRRPLREGTLAAQAHGGTQVKIIEISQKERSAVSKINSSLLALVAASLFAHSAHGMEGMALAAAALSTRSAYAMQDDDQPVATILEPDVEQLLKALQQPLAADTVFANTTPTDPEAVTEIMTGKRLADEAHVFLQEGKRLWDERGKIIAQLKERSSLREDLVTLTLALRNQQADPHGQETDNPFALSIARAAFELQGKYMKDLFAQAEVLKQQALHARHKGVELRFHADICMEHAAALTVLNKEHAALNKETETSNNMQS